MMWCVGSRNCDDLMEDGNVWGGCLMECLYRRVIKLLRIVRGDSIIFDFF